MYDIIIVGAGPGGLSLASELSKSHNCLVLDRSKIPLTTKSWYTFTDRLKKTKLLDTIESQPPYLEFRMHENIIEYKDKHAIINEQKILKTWKERSSANFKEGILVKGFRRDKEIISLRTSKGNFKAPLIIDCLGTQSPLAKKYQKNFFVWSIYGKNIKKNPKRTDLISFTAVPPRFQAKNDKKNYMLGIYPKGNNNTDVYIFNYYNYIPKNSAMILKNKYDKAIQHFFGKTKKSRTLSGNIYTGELNKYSEDNLLFFGDAGGLTPNATGMGFNEILRFYKLIANRVKKLDKPTEHNLKYVMEDLRQRPIVRFQKMLQDLFYYGNNSEIYEKGINLLNKAGKEFTRKWMRNELNTLEIKKGLKHIVKEIGIQEISKIYPKKVFIKNMLNTSRILGKNLLFEAHEIFHSHYGKQRCDLCLKCNCKA